jgi:preprotein translocase subunit Sss1
MTMRLFDSLKGNSVAKKTKKAKPWSIEDVRMLKTMVREKTKISTVARKLKRTETATRQKAASLGVKLVGALPRKKKA